MIGGYDSLTVLRIDSSTAHSDRSTLSRAGNDKQESCRLRKDRDAIQWSASGLAAYLSLRADVTQSAKMPFAGSETGRKPGPKEIITAVQAIASVQSMDRRDTTGAKHWPCK